MKTYIGYALGLAIFVVIQLIFSVQLAGLHGLGVEYAPFLY